MSNGEENEVKAEKQNKGEKEKAQTKSHVHAQEYTCLRPKV